MLSLSMLSVYYTDGWDLQLKCLKSTRLKKTQGTLLCPNGIIFFQSTHIPLRWANRDLVFFGCLSSCLCCLIKAVSKSLVKSYVLHWKCTQMHDRVLKVRLKWMHDLCFFFCFQLNPLLWNVFDTSGRCMNNGWMFPELDILPFWTCVSEYHSV